MKCPNCGEEIKDEEIARHLASKGGKKSKRTISPEAQDKMQKGRREEKLA